MKRSQKTATGAVRIKPKTAATRRASYLEGLDYIARNDDVECMDADFMAGAMTVRFLAALFGIPPADVAFDLVRVRGFISAEEAEAKACADARYLTVGAKRRAS